MRWTPEYIGKAWTTGSATWGTGTSPRRHTACPSLLPLLLRLPERDRVQAELEEGPRRGWTSWRSCTRPWIDAVTIRCKGGRTTFRASWRSGTWLDAGIVPFSTLAGRTPSRFRTAMRPARRRACPPRTCPTTPTGRSGSPPTGCRRCASRSVCGSTRSCSCRWPDWTGAVPVGPGLREDARRAWPGDARLVGQPDRGRGRLFRMGADVMRWQFCAQPPDQDLWFGYGRGTRSSESSSRSGTRCRSSSSTPNIRGIPRPYYADLSAEPSGDLQPLDRWLVAGRSRSARGHRLAMRRR